MAWPPCSSPAGRRRRRTTHPPAALRALRVARKVRAGQVFVNGYGAGGGIELPFGGMKKSGHGREKGFAALHDFAALKTMVVKHG